MKILVLYSELAGYFLASISAFVNKYGGEVHIVRWPVHPDAPFKFTPPKGVSFYNREVMSVSEMKQLGETLDADLIYITGWIDKSYLLLARYFIKKGKPVVCAMDNHWLGTAKQKIALLAKPILQRLFTHMWVPGTPQKKYAEKLGFLPAQILTGVYSGDTAPFMLSAKKNQLQKEKKYPHQFLFVGRLIKIKGIEDLIQAFLQLCDEIPHDWTLKVVGEGPLKEQLPKHPRIHYHDFVQPALLPDLAQDVGCFVLPSFFEPWGVVLHEFAASDLPIVASDACGSATEFLTTSKNGFLHKKNDLLSLKKALKKIIQTPDTELIEMGKYSQKLADKISPEKWADQLFKLISKNNPK